MELLNSLQSLDKTVKDEITVLPSTVLGDKRYGVINLSVANLRVAPEHSAEMATQSLLGTAVRVFNKKRTAGIYCKPLIITLLGLIMMV